MFGKKAAARKQKPDYVSQKDLWCWQSREVSRSIVILFAGFLMLYCTDTLQMSAAIVSVVMVVSKVVDAFSNAIAGWIVDNAPVTRWGKARPFELFVIGLWLANFLLFSTPSWFSMTAKVIWVFVMYTLVNSIFYPILVASNTVYFPRAFKKPQINKITSIGGIIVMLVSILFNILFPMMLKVYENSAAGWSHLALIWAIPMAILGLFRMFFIPEKYQIDSSAQDAKKANRVSWKDILTVLKNNRYIWIICFAGFFFNFITSMGVQVYYYKYIAHNVGAMGIVSAANIIVLPLAFLFPRWIKKFSTAKLMSAGFFIASLGYLINYFAGGNVPLLMVGQILFGAGAVPFSMLLVLLILDCADFNEYRGLARMEGTMSSLNNLMNMLGAALGSAGLGVFLSASGYTGSAATNSGLSILMIRLLFSVVPAVLFFMLGFCLLGYNKLDAQLPTIREALKKKRAQQASDKGTPEK